jgi:tetratricopeptide (TPR) repeat protein
MRRKAFGPNHELVAHSLVDYAWLLDARGDAAQAEQYGREALAIQRKFGRSDPDLMVATLHVLQVAAAQNRRYDQAEEFAQEALAIARRQPKPIAGEASVRRALAGVAIEQGDFHEAERLAHEALTLHRKIQGEQHMATGAAWDTLGNVYYRQKEFDEAEKCYRQAMSIFVKTHEYCPVRILTLLAVILDARGDRAGLDELRPLADAEEKKADAHHWQQLASRGSLRAKLGDWEKAEAFLKQSIEQAPDYAADDLAWADYLIALLRLRAGDAAGYRGACAAGINRQLTKAEPKYFFVVWASAIAPESAVNLDQLVELAAKSVESSPGDPDCLTAYGAALYRHGRWKEAKTALGEAATAYQSFRGASRGTVINAQLLLAMTLARLGQEEQARQSFDAAIAVLEAPSSRSQGDYGGMSWDRRLIAQRFTQEAEQLLMPEDGESP